ncbi:hypothetical protein GGTG_03561 [Gaeumannomyces tritici R3-111a-1]|uniref:Uncharacterized protein n=1 Tax=Gaeumannomyces tritici (strain R3-111a-1) TaxID=644352 RepID=J3NQK5_GAET3|nr:hypothetical protein GGTG_03561 [Gaeumannomyces tritici R3-111a-1]EJT78461.1 hypothetical protein GGTG_03561 [Gaeumannomyces tritici R3-111a-1]
MSDIKFQGWTPIPNTGRGTASIIWSCAATIFLTTWAAHHPMPRLARFVRSIMLPEYQTFHAIDLLIGSLKLRNIIRVRPGWRDWKLCQAFHSTYTYDDFAGPKIVAHKQYCKVSPSTFVDLVKTSKILRSDAPSLDDIYNRTGSDRLAKTLTVFQVLWFLANVAWRLATKRHLSLLEVLTIAYVVCGLSVYVALFSCPQVVKEPSIVAASGTLGTTSMASTLPTSLELDGQNSHMLWVMMGSVCASVYLAAWNYPFNSPMARWLWRGSSMAMLPLTVLQRRIEQQATRIDNKYLPWKTWVAWEFVLFSLAVPRLILIGVGFWALERMPSDVYDNPQWESYIGHFWS